MKSNKPSVFIDGEAGRIRSNFKQDASRLTKVNRPEVLPIDLLGWADVVTLDELSDHRSLCLIVRGTEGNVVHRTATKITSGEALRLMYVDHATVLGGWRTIPDHRALSADLDKVQNISEHGCR